MKLTKMTKEEFDSFLFTTKQNYKQDKIRANDLTPHEAEEIATNDLSKLLPQGYQSKDSFLFMILDSNESKVGHLWYVIQGAENNKKAFITDILIYKEHRGQGLGKKTMLLLEEHVKAQGLNSIGLHVFGFNQRAINLYKALDYKITDLVMVKNL